MRRQISVGLCASTLLLGGCVGTLETRPNRAVTSPDAALSGISYALPKVRYDVKLRRSLAECPVGLINGKPTALKFAIDVSATPVFLAGESYQVDYEKLAGWLRTANFEIKLYPNGTLKSIGAGAEDKTAETISSIAKTAFSLTTVVGLSAGGDGQIPPPTKLLLCTAQAAKDVAEARQIEADLKTKKQELETAGKTAERLRAAGAARIMNDQMKNDYVALLMQIGNAEATIAAKKTRYGELADALGVSDDIVWDGGATAPDYDKQYPLSPGQLKKMSALLVEGPPPADYPTDTTEALRRKLTASCFEGGAPDICLTEQLALRSGLYLERDLKACDDGGTAPECWSEVGSRDTRYRAARDAVPDGGIFVREAMTGRLLFCRDSVVAAAAVVAAPVAPAQPQDDVDPSAGGDGGLQGGPLGGSPTPPTATAVPAKPPGCTVDRDEAEIAAGDFPQFGQLRFLPLRVGTFQARELAVQLSETGRIESFIYKSTKAPAQAAASATADVAGQLDTYLEKRETERRDDVKYAREQEIAVIKQEISVLTEQAALKKLKTPAEVDPLQPTRDETALLQADIALLKAKLERLQAEAAYNAALIPLVSAR